MTRILQSQLTWSASTAMGHVISPNTRLSSSTVFSWLHLSDTCPQLSRHTT